jgi:hypothetical protein
MACSPRPSGRTSCQPAGDDLVAHDLRRRLRRPRRAARPDRAVASWTPLRSRSAPAGRASAPVLAIALPLVGATVGAAGASEPGRARRRWCARRGDRRAAAAGHPTGESVVVAAGPSRVGKSTLADALVHELPVEVERVYVRAATSRSTSWARPTRVGWRCSSMRSVRICRSISGERRHVACSGSHATVRR